VSVFASIGARISSAFSSVFNRGPQYVNPTPGGLGSLMAPSWSGNLDAMGAVSTLYAIVRLLSTSTAQVDWHLYRKQTDGRRVYGPGEDNRTEIVRHQALNVWDRPNPLMTGMQFRERIQMSLDLTGEAFWIVERAAGIPVELWPVRPDRMSEVVNENGLIGWTYKEPDGTRTPFTKDEVIAIMMPHPSNMFRGMGPVQSLTVDLESVRAAGQYNRNYFLNSAAPSGVILAPNELTDREFERVAMQWGERHKGVRNAHRVGILENGLTWHDTTTSMRDMQFVDMRNMSRELIREAFGIHKHMLGLADDVNRANALAASDDFARWQLTPRLERIRQALNYQFLPMFGGTGNGVEFEFEDPTPEDREGENAERQSKVTAVVALIREGADPASALEAMGLPPIEWKEREPVPTAPQIAPISPAPAPPPTEGDEADAQREIDAATVAALLKEAFA
jgi:HK97 family phage portal protein